MFEKYKEDIDTILLMHLCAPYSISKMDQRIKNIDPDLLKVSIKEHRYDEVTEAIEKKTKGKPIKDGLKK